MSTSSRGTRRRVLAVLASAALVAVGTNAAASSASPACGQKLAVVAPKTGPAAPLGMNMVRGADLAVDRYNDNHPGCTVTLKQYDTQGDPSLAPSVATQIINDPAIIGVVGHAFSGESLATGKTYYEAGLPTLTPSATNPLVAAQGWTTFHRLIANDSKAGLLLGRFIGARPSGDRVVLVVDDGEYSRVLIRAARLALGARAIATLSVRQGQTNFASTVAAIRSKHAHAVIFGGYYPEGGLLAKQLFAAGYGGTFAGGEGIMDPTYAKLAGSNATSHTFIGSGSAPPTLNSTFAQVYKAAYDKPVGLYSLEANDAAKVFLAGIDQGVSTRAAMSSWVNAYDANGLTKHVSFTSKGELVAPPIWIYKPYQGSFVAKARVQ